MRFERMLPHQIRHAIADNTPVALALGVMEYHGEHMAVGMDLLAVTEILTRLEAEMDLVILPPFAYGAASYAVAGPEGTGSMDIDASKISALAEDMFFALLRIGFRNIHGIIHHQSENFTAGMPTDLAFKFAARRALFRYLQETRGEGWWGDNAMVDYYAEHATGSDPFNWIKIHPLMGPEVKAHYPFDHAGAGETALMMELAPDVVEAARMAQNTAWYTSSATKATPELGAKGVSLIMAEMRKRLS